MGEKFQGANTTVCDWVFGNSFRMRSVTSGHGWEQMTRRAVTYAVVLNQPWKTAGRCASRLKCLWSVYSVIWKAVEPLYRGQSRLLQEHRLNSNAVSLTSVRSPLWNMQGQRCINHGFTSLLTHSHLPPNTRTHAHNPSFPSCATSLKTCLTCSCKI